MDKAAGQVIYFFHLNIGQVLVPFPTLFLFLWSFIFSFFQLAFAITFLASLLSFSHSAPTF